MYEELHYLLEHPAPQVIRRMGSAQCPKCGRFASITSVQNDSAPMSAEQSSVINVNCAVHGWGEA